jgi:two-component system alkaline phosphatase synthesis response regulator PhoP
LVEDEPGLVLTLSDLLTGVGYEVDSAGDGNSGLAKALGGGFDVILLDVMLPGMSGMEVCRELRRREEGVAILMLTARTQLADRVGGLKLGADDYLTKPFEPPELLARIEALLRRVGREKLALSAPVRFGDVEVDFDRNSVLRNGRPIGLAGKEMELLRYLIERRGQPVSREELLKGVWGYHPGVTSRTVDVHVAWLRQKLEDNFQAPRYIHTVRGVGYRFLA